MKTIQRVARDKQIFEAFKTNFKDYADKRKLTDLYLELALKYNLDERQIRRIIQNMIDSPECTREERCLIHGIQGKLRYVQSDIQGLQSPSLIKYHGNYINPNKLAPQRLLKEQIQTLARFLDYLHRHEVNPANASKMLNIFAMRVNSIWSKYVSA